MIKAPYNFVPLSEKVFFPDSDWADRVSHDIPFSDGESGEIDITITAKSPIFIRDHKHKEEFCQHKLLDGTKQYYIPGTSVKNMVRNVLEIMSFSKMKFVDDKTFKNDDREMYQHSIYDGIPASHKQKDLDLSEILFGYIDDDKSLKGRIQFSHFKEISNTCTPYSDTVKLVLGTPKASYYPIYLKQGNSTLCIADRHATYDDEEFRIAGWKRYPLHQSFTDTVGECTKNDTVSTCFYPLKSGASFSGKIRYHNLKRAELGALLSSALFHKTEETYHNIGLAKAFGFGKIEVKINDIISKANNIKQDTLKIENIEKYLKIFEAEIIKDLSQWANTEQLTELITMASVQNRFVDDSLVYMPLHDGDESYVQNKEEQDGAYNFLCPFTQWDNVTIKHVNSLLSDSEVEKIICDATEQRNQEAEDREANTHELIERIIAQNTFVVPGKKELRKKIDTFIKDKLDFTLPKYYAYEHLCMFLRNTINELSDDFKDTKNEYKNLTNESPLIIDLLKKREYGDATDEELGVLYYLLNKKLNA